MAASRSKLVVGHRQPHLTVYMYVHRISILTRNPLADNFRESKFLLLIRKVKLQCPR
jgi:hypothetical protein